MKRSTAVLAAIAFFTLASLPAARAEDSKDTQALAGKGLSVEPEKNVIQELSGSPEADSWEPSVEVFKDLPHVARSSEQLTLMALGKASLADIITRVQQKQPGTVFSVTPIIRNHKPAAEVLVADHGKVKKLIQPL